ncbi:hypothetical protein ABPG73_014261 [Tetrahymena malaccensis]
MKQSQNPQPYKIVDDYVIYQDKMLGNGSYGQVFQGINKNTKENVAIKVIPIKKIEAESQNPQVIFQQIKNEITNMQLIEGQHIVKLIDKKKSSNSIYLILEYCNGGNLQSILKHNQGSLSESQAVNIIYQITEGYKCLLAKNMAHRDLKPANILFKDGIAKIADFGFSKVVGFNDDTKLRHSILGSPQYMSPQLLSQQEYCPKKADMWSLGMIFYEMLYRKVPWRADSPQDLLSQIQQKPLEFPAAPQVSLIVKKVISYMLKIEESDRISWEELINEPLFESQTKLDVLLQSLNSVEMRFVNDSFMKMKEYCRLYIEQNRVFHNLFECHQKESFNKHIIDCNVNLQNFSSFSDNSIDSNNNSNQQLNMPNYNNQQMINIQNYNSGFNNINSQTSVQSNNSNGGDGSGSHHQEIQNLYDYTIQLQKRQFIINKMTDYYLKKRNKGIFFAHLAILLSDIFDIRQSNQEVQNSVNEAFMLRHTITLFKKGYLKIYKALRKIKTNEPDQCTKFILDDYKTFELSNERTQLRKYFNFDLNMLKCLFDELLQKIMAFIKKNLPNYSPQEKALYESFQPIFNNTMTEKEKFNPLFKQSVLEQNKLYRMIIKNITPQQLGTEQEQMDNNNLYKKLSSLAFYIDCVDKQYKMFKQDTNLDYCKFYETYERSTSKTLINLVLNQP